MTKKKYKKYGQFLSLALCFSALIHPVHAMDWSDVFNPDDHDPQGVGRIGFRIFSFLNDRALGRGAQVSKKWNRLLHYTRNTESPAVYSLPVPLIRPQQELMRDILKSLQAQSDPFSSLIEEIRGTSFTTALAALSQGQQSTLKSKFPNLIDPSLSLYPWHLLRNLKTLRDEKTLTPTHNGFKRLTELIETLQSLGASFSTLKSPLERLGKVYHDYRQTLCTLLPGDRGALLSPVFLSGDFLKGRCLISDSRAYELLSMDEEELSEKTNPTGSSIVSHVGTLYAKQNLIRKHDREETPTGTLDPGMEWAMSSFHRLVFGEGLVPSCLILLSSVPINETLSLEKQEEKELLKQEANHSNNGNDYKNEKRNRLHEDLSFKTSKTYALQVTPEISGEFLGTFLEKALKTPALFETLDVPQVQGLILSALLTHPADAKGDNFIVTLPDARGKCQIISIDNDLALASMVIKEKENFHVLETRNLLFCIPYFMDQKIDKTLKDHILSLNPSHVLLTWLKGLSLHNRQYKKLFKEEDPQTESVRPPETTAAEIGVTTTTTTTVNDSLSPLVPSSVPTLLKLPLKLKAGTGVTLLKRFQNLQYLLTSRLFSTPSLKDLFEEMEPLGAIYTKHLIRHAPSPLKAFEHLYKQDISFEKLCLLEKELPNGRSVGEVLFHKSQEKDAYKARHHTLEDMVEEVLKNTDLSQLPLETQKALLEEAASGFPETLKACLHHFPVTIYEVLKLNPSPALMEALLENPSYKLAPSQLFSLAQNLLDSSLPHQRLLLEKLLHLPHFDFGERDDQGNTLLHLLANRPQPTFLSFLMDQWTKKGGNFDALNRAGESILDKAFSAFHLSLVEELLKKGEGKTYKEQNLELFYQKIKQQNTWKGSNLHGLFQQRKERDPHWKWALQRSKIFLPPAAGEDIEILTYNQGRIISENRILAQNVIDQLWDREGTFHSLHTNNHRMVGRVIFYSKDPSKKSQGHAIYFKRFPGFPGISMAISLLQEMLFGEGFLPLTFAKIKGEPFLVSPGIGKIEQDEKGTPCEASNFQTLLEASSDRLNLLDEEALAQVIIMAMLTNPEDGKPSNYALETIKSTGRSRIMGFDEEQAFVPAVSKAPETTFEKLTSVMVQMKSILFCMDAMTYHLPPGVKKTIFTWDEFKLIKTWIQTLERLDEKMQGIFKGEIGPLFKQKESYIGIPFQAGETTALLNKLYALKLYAEAHPTASLMDLFLHTEPFAAIRYRPILSELKSLSLLERFLKIDGGIYEQNKGFFERAFAQKDRFPTSLRSGHLLNARKIPDFESRKEKLKKGRRFDPIGAMEELTSQEAKIAKNSLQKFKAQSTEQASTISSLLKGENPGVSPIGWTKRGPK